MLCDEFPEYGIRGAKTIGATPVTHPPARGRCGRGDRRGARRPAPRSRCRWQDQFYGERSGSFRDPFGHRWNIGHSIEEVATEEMQRRYTEMLKSD